MGVQSDLLAEYELPSLHPLKFARRLMDGGGGDEGKQYHQVEWREIFTCCERRQKKKLTVL